MPVSSVNCKSSSAPLHGTAACSDTLTGRAGMALFSRYLRALGLLPQLGLLFGGLRKSGKGLPVALLFKQILCFLFEGTSRHLTYFDHLQQDEGYAGAIEPATDQMASSHQIKRFFYGFTIGHRRTFRFVLARLFRWRLKLEAPEVVVLGPQARWSWTTMRPPGAKASATPTKGSGASSPSSSPGAPTSSTRASGAARRTAITARWPSR